MGTMNPNAIYDKMLAAIDRLYTITDAFPWESERNYANWLAQSFYYVQWTTRQLALASARTRPGSEDTLHWRFMEEAKEEKRHELLAASDLKNLGYRVEAFPELPHTAFFYQSLSYMIEREHPVVILGYSLTLEGYAAKKLSLVYPRVKNTYSDSCCSFMRLHCEVDVEHFNNALPHLHACPTHLLPVIDKGIDLCLAVYGGILKDIVEWNAATEVAKSPHLSRSIDANNQVEI